MNSTQHAIPHGPGAVTWLPVLLLLATACTTEQHGEDSRSAAPARDTGRHVEQHSGADRPGGATAAQRTSHDLAQAYDFESPDLAVKLHKDLTEISGLTSLPDGRLAAVQDEDGILFVLNAVSGAIDARVRFGGGGDYEGVERVGDRIYVLRSDGSLIEVDGWTDDRPDTRRIKTPLSEKNDTEGLVYDSGRLLIACKEDPGDGVDDRYKAVYAFDVSEEVFLSEPVFLIDTDEIDRRSDTKASFKPSALALHPTDGSVYVLSSTSKVLAQVDRTGTVLNVVQLPGRMFEQPEALAFLPDGTLYVASEGVDGPGMLYSYSPVDR